MSVYISSLPVYTGTAADLRWFIMNNSGETTTFKYSGYSSQLIPGQGTGSYMTPGNTTGANSLAVGDGNTAGGGQSFMFGYNNTDNSNNRIIGIGSGNNIGSAWSVALGYSNTLVGSNFSTESVLIGYGNTINGTGVNTGNINIGQSQTISDGSYNTILNGKSNALQGGYYNTILNGSGNTIGSSYSGVSMLSCFGRTADASNTTYVESIRGFGNFNFGSTNTNTSVNGGVAGGINNNNTSTRGVIIGGNGNNAGGTSNIVGGENNTTNGYVTFAYGTNNTNNAEVAFIGGGASCNAAGQTIGIIGAEQATTVGATNVMKQSFIGGGFQNNITTSLRASIIAGQVNTITSSPDSAIIGGTGNTITSLEKVVMLGTSGRTADASNTTYVENLHIYRTPSTTVQPISTGTTFTCNLELGAKSQFYITGASTINITNVRDGASFMIKTQTDGNYVMTWTATGYTFVFEGGIKDPGNTTTDIFVFEVFGSVIYGSRRHNFS